MQQRPEPRIERILCPTDFSDFSRNALWHALAIASAYDAAVTVLHVMPQTLMHPELFPYIKEPILVPLEIRERAQAHLDRLTIEVETGGVPFDVALESGEAAHRILSCAESLPADLVVVGARGRGALERLVLGSVTERLLSMAQTPTLVVEEPPRRSPENGFPYRRILLLTDASGRSDAALDWAVSFSRKSGGSLVLARVGEDEGRENRRSAPGLEGSAADLAILDPRTTVEALRRLASESDADLIVFTSYDPTARELVRSGERPVLVMSQDPSRRK